MVTYNIDTVLLITNSSDYRIIGSRSKYATEEHPATGKKIAGWQWDIRHWTRDNEFKGSSNAPTLWDASVSGLDSSYFRSGYGDNLDLFTNSIDAMYLDDPTIWAPNINHGFFYIHEEERYLFSDDYQTEYLTHSGLVSGHQVLDLTYTPKMGIPVLVRQYEYDRSIGRHKVSFDARKRVEFSTTPDSAEFILTSRHIELDGDYSETIGISNPSSAEVSGLEHVGYGDGTDWQFFHTQFSPIDTPLDLSEVEIYTYSNSTSLQSWNVLSPDTSFSVSGYEVQVDRDMGLLQFGERTSTHAVPGPGHNVAIYYRKGIGVFYEPQNTRDYVLARTANLNPIKSIINRGFVTLSTSPQEPASISLSADLPLSSSSYLIYMGNNTGKLTAEVKNKEGVALEGEQVTFELLSPIIGYLNRSSIATSTTYTNGRATTIYLPPVTVDEIQSYSTDITVSGTDTEVIVNNLLLPVSVSGLYLYKVHNNDITLGIPNSELTTYYSDWITDQTISGYTGNPPWEPNHRLINDLGVPSTYSSGDISTGKKTIVFTNTRSEVIDPHSGTQEASSPYNLGPIYPNSMLDIGTVSSPKLKLTYSTVLESPGAGTTKSYLVVGDSQTRIRAYVTNSRTGKKLYSNTIQLSILVPNTMNGTFFAEELASIPSGLLFAPQNISTLSDITINATSGIADNYSLYLDEHYRDELYKDWYKRTRRGDTIGLLQDGLGPTSVSVDPTAVPGEIPLGFRLKSSTITLASILDQITFVDLNDNLPSGYFGG